MSRGLVLLLVITACGAPPSAAVEGSADADTSDVDAPDAGGVRDAGPSPADDAGESDSGNDAAVDAGTADAGARTIWVLFDAAHKNAVGNANWVLDSQAPAPAPLHPTVETQWSGGISSWGFDLHATGRYEVRQLPVGITLTFGGGGPGDLGAFDVFVTDEPEEPFTAGEQAALLQFVEAGRGILFVADHAGAKRCTTCTEAWRVINAVLVTGSFADTLGVHLDGNTIGQSGLNGTVTGSAHAAHFAAGPFGTASELSFHSGSSVSASANAAASVVVAAGGVGMMAASVLPSGGRVVVLGDSSPTDDGTCGSCGARLYDGWAEVSNANFILNATAWAARDGS